MRVRVFILTWITYASYYLCRKPLSVTKSSIASEFSFGLAALGTIETAFLAAYAVGQFASGSLGDRIGARRLLVLGLVSSALASVAFGLSAGLLGMTLFFTINGLAQSTGWPGTIKAMTPWFAPRERGRVMGPWSTCYQIGGLVATALATFLLASAGWRAAFWVPALWLIGLALVLWRSLPAQEPTTPERAKPAASAMDRVQMWRRPRVWLLGGAYFFLKLIRYTLLFWLPFYLHRQLGYSETRAGYQSIAFELGGAFGATIGGALSDRLPGRRGRVSIAMTLELAVALYGYALVARVSPLANFAGLFGVGFLLFGPDALVSSVAAQDLGGSEQAASAAGIINGLGSVGAVVQGVFIAAWVSSFGWESIFPLFVVLALVATALLLPTALRDPDPRARTAQGSGSA